MFEFIAFSSIFSVFHLLDEKTALNKKKKENESRIVKIETARFKTSSSGLSCDDFSRCYSSMSIDNS